MKLNDIDLNKLQVFRVLAEAGSMREAARILQRTPSAISQSLSSLERTLGTPLFNRIGIRIFLTDEGKRLFSGLKHYQADLQSLLSGITREKPEVIGQVRLGLYTGIPAGRIGSPMAKVLRRHSALQVKLRFGSHGAIAESLAQNRLDLALSITPLQTRNRNVVSRLVLEEELILVASPSLAWSRKPEELSQVSVIEYFESAPLFGDWLSHHFGDHYGNHFGKAPAHAPRVRAYCATLEHVLEAVRFGLGCAVVPRAAVKSELRQRTLKAHPGAGSATSSKGPLLGRLYLNQAKSTFMSAGAEALRNALSEPFS